MIQATELLLGSSTNLADTDADGRDDFTELTVGGNIREADPDAVLFTEIERTSFAVTDSASIFDVPSTASAGDIVLVGQPDEDSGGRVIVYDCDGQTFLPRHASIGEDDRFGQYLATDGNIIAVAAANQTSNGSNNTRGVVYLYERSSEGNWEVFQIINRGSGSTASWGVGMAIEEGLLLVGDPSACLLYTSPSPRD